MITSSQTTIYLLSPFISETHPFFQQLKQSSHFKFQLLNLRSMTYLHNNQHKYMILIDGHFSEEELFELQNHILLRKSYASIFFHAPKQDNLLLVSQWKNLSGYFPLDTSVDEILIELIEIEKGRNRLPRYLLSNLFQYWQGITQSNNHNVVAVKLALTRRELEILNHLQIGQSNLDIADSLFVSEHTIKSHLYRIFKKLNVNNRRQAINWAHLYL
ncbi:MAG: response regulator transcription factor [Vibrio hibernica]